MESAEFDSPHHHDEHQPPEAHSVHEHDAQHGTGHGAHVDHTGHEEMFRNRFWVCLALSIPVLLYSPTIQGWLGFTAPPFPGSQWVTPVFSVIVFLYGGVPFLRMAVPELRDGRPGMMTLTGDAQCAPGFWGAERARQTDA
jgi:Cu2+-exporting ATPase